MAAITGIKVLDRTPEIFAYSGSTAGGLPANLAIYSNLYFYDQLLPVCGATAAICKSVSSSGKEYAPYHSSIR